MWNLPQHNYEEIREVVVDVLSKASTNGVNQFSGVLEHTARSATTSCATTSDWDRLSRRGQSTSPQRFQYCS